MVFWSIMVIFGVNTVTFWNNTMVFWGEKQWCLGNYIFLGKYSGIFGKYGDMFCNYWRKLMKKGGILCKYFVGFERDEDNVSFYWDNKGQGSIVPIPLTSYSHGGGFSPLSIWCSFRRQTAETAMLVLQKKEKWKSLKWNISRIVSSLAKTSARTFDQNFVWPPEEGDLQWHWQTDKQTNKHTQEIRF